MKKLKSLKLSSLSKSALKEREMSKIYGGAYCAWSDYNRAANENEGKCSCACSGDYYSQGKVYNGDFYNQSSAWGYC